MIQPAEITYVILGVAILLLLSDRVRPDLVALLVALSLGLTGVISVQEAFSGFSRSAVFTILAIFILAEGLQRTGVTDQLGKWLFQMAGSSEFRLIISITLAGAILSLFMNNIAAASVLLPVVMGVSRKSDISPSRLLIPLAFGTILGGMATLFTTTNIVASSLLRDHGLAGFGVLDFAPLGAPIILAGVLYISLWGRKALPIRFPRQNLGDIKQVEDNLTEVYRLKERLLRGLIPIGSSLAGKPLSQSGLRETYRLNVIAIERNKQVLLSPSPATVTLAGDILLVSGRLEEIPLQEIQPMLNLLPMDKPLESDLESRSITLVEVVLAPRSNLIGQTLSQVHFREKFDMSVIAIWRAGRPIRTGLSDLALQFGDGLLLLGPLARLETLRSEPNIILLSNGDHKHAVVQRKKGWLALAIMAVSIVLASLYNASIGEIMLGGALAMVLVGILSMDEAYRSVDWKTIFIVAGMLPLGIALTETGAAASLGKGALALAGGTGPLALLAVLVILAMLLSQVMNGAAVTTIMVPVAISAASSMSLDARALVMGIALATSITFILPFGHPVNILVMGPGGYQMRDYLRVGLPLAVLLLILVIFLLPVIWPLSLI